MKGNILDLNLTNCPDLITDVSALQGKFICNLSDHDLVLIQLSPFHALTRNSNNHGLQSYVFKKGNYQAMDEFLQDVDMDPILNSKEVEFIWLSLKDLIPFCHFLACSNL